MSDSPGVLIVGGNSAVGTALARHHVRAGRPVTVTTHRNTDPRLQLDLAQPEDFAIPHDVDVAYLCGAVTGNTQCNHDRSYSRRVNVDGTARLLERLAARGIFCVFFSTNLVFDGHVPHVLPNHPRSPACEYGRQKADLESWLLERQLPAAIVRVTKIVDSIRPLLSTWAGDLAQGREIRPFSDLHLAPVSMAWVVEHAAALGRQRRSGIHHISATEDVSYSAVAEQLAAHLGASSRLIEPGSARRTLHPDDPLPLHTTLSDGPDRMRPSPWDSLQELFASLPYPVAHER